MATPKQKTLGIRKLDNEALMPTKGTTGSAMIDLYVLERTYLPAKRTIKVRTGIAMDIPTGHYVLVFPRSSISKTDLRMANSVGVIDNDYKGEILLPITNTGKRDYYIGKHDRICQFTLEREVPFKLEEIVDNLEQDLEAAHKGFGSTGK